MLKRRLALLNLSPLPRTHWTRQIAVPWSAPTGKAVGSAELPIGARFLCDDGREFLAIRGEDVGRHSATYRIRAALGAGERVEGTLLGDQDVVVPPWAVHPWVTDNLAALFPLAGLMAADGSMQQCDYMLEGPTLVGYSMAHQRWYVRCASPALGLVQEVYADILLGDPVVHLWGCVTWSDRRVPARTKLFQGLMGLSSGERLAIDYADRHRWQQFEHAGRQVVLFGRDIAMIDGGSVPFSGSILAFRGPGVAYPDWTPGSPDEADAQNLLAAQHGPILGVCEEWAGSWLLTGHTPNHSGLPVQQGGVGAGLFAPRPQVCAPWPGQTGDQADFGSTKGTGAVSGFDPRWIYEAIYAAQSDCFRGQRHFEADGTALDPAKHPNWITWGGRTLYALWDKSDDATLGKDGGYWPENPQGGYEGYDDEHRSQNTMAAVIALCGDPLLISQMLHQSTVDVCSYTHKQGSIAAARAEGRLSQTWAHMAMLLPGEAQRRAVEMLDKRFALAKTAPLLNVSGPVKVIANHDPDPRKPIRDPAGNLLPTWTVWEHALHLLGAFLASSQATDRAGAWATVEKLARTIAEFGCFRGRDGLWRVCSDLEYKNDGAAVILDEASPSVLAATNAGDVRSWTMVGLLVARDVLPSSDPLQAKLDACIAAMGVDVRHPFDARTAEWWAAVRS